MALFLTKEAREERRLHAIDNSHYRWVVYQRDDYYDGPWRWFILDMNTFPTDEFDVDEYESRRTSRQRIPEPKYFVASGGAAGRLNERKTAENAARERVAELMELEGHRF